MSAAPKQSANALDRSSQPSATRSIVQSVETSASQGHPVSPEVPIGVVEIPVEVWGSRRAVPISGQPGRIKVFSEETCTVIVFPHGAVIRLSAALAPGQLMMVTNRNSGQVVPCRVVSVRSYPNMRGYAEIEFMQSAETFWGAYVPQGTTRLTARIPLATPEQPTKLGPDAPRPASSQPWIPIPSATSPKPPALSSTPPENLRSSSFPKQVNSVLASAATASPVLPLTVPNKAESIESRAIQNPSVGKPVGRAAMAATASESRLEATQRSVSKTNPLPPVAVAGSSKLAVPSTQEHHRDESASERSARSWMRGLLGSLSGQVISRTATNKTPPPRRRRVLVWVTVTSLFMMGAIEIFLLHHGAAGSAATTVSPIANTMQSPQPESNSSSVIPKLPIIAKTRSFPGAQARELADNIRISQPPVRMPGFEWKIPNGKLLAPSLVARRSAAAISRDLPPDLTGVDSNTGVGATQGFLAAFLPRGGRVKAPQLVFRSMPSYPTAARQAGIEGPVTIGAVIDTTGTLTSMKVVSGSPLLQQAALDSLRTSKYEPGYLDDKPVAVETSITVQFRLR